MCNSLADVGQTPEGPGNGKLGFGGLLIALLVGGAAGGCPASSSSEHPVDRPFADQDLFEVVSVRPIDNGPQPGPPWTGRFHLRGNTHIQYPGEGKFRQIKVVGLRPSELEDVLNSGIGAGMMLRVRPNYRGACEHPRAEHLKDAIVHPNCKPAPLTTADRIRLARRVFGLSDAARIEVLSAEGMFCQTWTACVVSPLRESIQHAEHRIVVASKPGESVEDFAAQAKAALGAPQSDHLRPLWLVWCEADVSITAQNQPQGFEGMNVTIKKRSAPGDTSRADGSCP